MRKLFKSKKKKTVLENIKSKIIKINASIKSTEKSIQSARKKHARNIVKRTRGNSFRTEEFESANDLIKRKLNDFHDHTIPNLKVFINREINNKISESLNEEDMNAIINYGKIAQNQSIQLEDLKTLVESLTKKEIKNVKKTKKAVKKFFKKLDKLINLLNELNQLLDNYKTERFPSTAPEDVELKLLTLPTTKTDLVTSAQKEEIEINIIAEPMIKDDHGMGSKVEELLRPTKGKKLKGNHKKSATQKDMITFILTMKNTNTLTLLIGALWVVEHVLDSEIPLHKTCKDTLRAYFKKEYKNEQKVLKKEAKITLDKEEAVGALNTYISERTSITLFKHKKWNARDAIMKHHKEYEIANNMAEYAKNLKDGVFTYAL